MKAKKAHRSVSGAVGDDKKHGHMDPSEISRLERATATSSPIPVLAPSTTSSFPSYSASTVPTSTVKSEQQQQ